MSLFLLPRDELRQSTTCLESAFREDRVCMCSSNIFVSAPVVKLPLTSFQKSAFFNSSLAEVSCLVVKVLNDEARTTCALYVIGFEVMPRNRRWWRA